MERNQQIGLEEMWKYWQERLDALVALQFKLRTDLPVTRVFAKSLLDLHEEEVTVRSLTLWAVPKTKANLP